MTRLLDRVDEIIAAHGHYRKLRPLSLIEALVVHRQEMGETTLTCADAFSDRKLGTGGYMPYHFIVRRDGVIEQAVALEVAAPGASRLNRVGVQISVFGDFRKVSPPAAQSDALRDLLLLLTYKIGKCSISGHTLAMAPYGGTPGKICPGDKLGLEIIRQDVWTKFATGEKIKIDGTLRLR